MSLFKVTKQIDFMAQRRIATKVSIVLMVIAVISLGVRGLNFGIDFTGGTLIEVGYADTADINAVRDTLTQAGFDEAVVQNFGTSKDVLVRIAPREGVSQATLGDQVLESLRKSSGATVELRRVEFVGPQVGAELAEDGGLAMLIALLAIFIYVLFRFVWKLSLGAVIALFHDVLLTLGVFSLLQLNFDLTVLAAVLAVIGYSLNDTIVVSDRIRENFRKMRKGTPVEIVNQSLNQTLARTIMTSVTTLLVLLALYFVGGELIHGFATALTIGVLVGTYSSIYVASTCALALGICKQDLMPVAKEGADIDARP